MDLSCDYEQAFILRKPEAKHDLLAGYKFK